MRTVDELFESKGVARRMFSRQEIKDLIMESWKQGMNDAAKIGEKIAATYSVHDHESCACNMAIGYVISSIEDTAASRLC